jgi:hypothetical protein
MHELPSFPRKARCKTVIVVVLAAASCATKPVERQSRAEVWSTVIAAEGAQPGGEWRIIEGIRLVKTEEGVSATAACLSSLLGLQLDLATLLKRETEKGLPIPKDDEFFTFYSMRVLDDVGTRFTSDRALPPGRETNRNVLAIIAKHTARAREMVQQVTQEVKGKPYRTWGVRNAFLLEKYVRESGSVAALRTFAAERKLKVGLEEERPASFSRIRKSVDHGSPVLLCEDRTTMLCVGYAVSKGEELLVVFRPELGAYREQTGKDNVNPKDLGSDVPWIKNAVASEMKRVRYFDRELRRTPDMPKGIDVITFSGPELDALYVGPWGPDIDDMVAEIEREVGLAAPKK